MSNKLSLLAVGLLASFSLAAHAGHNAAGAGHKGGMASQHMSAQGMSNTNGLSAVDRDKGMARAEERRNAEATTHAQAEMTQGAHKSEKPEKHKSR